MNFHWRNHAWEHGNPQVIGEHIERLADRNGGKLTIEILVKDARRENSPLHGLLDWDNERAADKYRAARMRTVLSVLGTSYQGESVRAFFGFGTVQEGINYRPLDRVLKSSKLREQHAAKQIRLLSRWTARNVFLPELEPTRRAIQKALESGSFATA